MARLSFEISFHNPDSKFVAPDLIKCIDSLPSLPWLSLITHAGVPKMTEKGKYVVEVEYDDSPDHNNEITTQDQVRGELLSTFHQWYDQVDITPIDDKSNQDASSAS